VTTLIFKLDDNLRAIDETVQRIPLQASETVSLAASTSDSAIINVPSGEMWFIKSWTVTKGADVTITSITVDGNDTYEIAAVADVISRYGGLITADSNVVISGSNAGLAAQSLEIQVDGYKIAGV
jgi:uncharacterized Zn finger protein